MFANVQGFAMPCLKTTKLNINTKNFIKMKKSTTKTFKHGIAKPMLPDVIDKQVKKINDTVTEFGGKVNLTDKIGRKKLAYEIQKLDKGDFWVLDLESEETLKIKEFNLLLDRETNIIRYLILKK